MHAVSPAVAMVSIEAGVDRMCVPVTRLQHLCSRRCVTCWHILARLTSSRCSTCSDPATEELPRSPTTTCALGKALHSQEDVRLGEKQSTRDLLQMSGGVIWAAHPGGMLSRGFLLPNVCVRLNSKQTDRLAFVSLQQYRADWHVHGPASSEER